jgi:hypothetical protein
MRQFKKFPFHITGFYIAIGNSDSCNTDICHISHLPDTSGSKSHFLRTERDNSVTVESTVATVLGELRRSTYQELPSNWSCRRRS